MVNTSGSFNTLHISAKARLKRRGVQPHVTDVIARSCDYGAYCACVTPFCKHACAAIQLVGLPLVLLTISSLQFSIYAFRDGSGETVWMRMIF